MDEEPKAETMARESVEMAQEEVVAETEDFAENDPQEMPAAEDPV